MAENTDRLFDTHDKVGDFEFDSCVAEVFDDMVARSVPLYSEIQNMVASLAAKLIQPGTAVFGLGSATGNNLLKLAEEIPDPNIRLIGIDSSEAMNEKASAKLREASVMDRCELRTLDLNVAEDFGGASVILMNYTLQFIRPLFREPLIRKIHDALPKNGAFIVVEKVLSKHSALNRLYIELYYDMKKRHSYSELEIAKKREALENILIPYQIEENFELMRRCGFEMVDIFVRWYNFAGFIAIKS